MIVEKRDRRTGTLLFVEDEDTLNIKYLMKKIKELEERIEELEKAKGTLK